MCLLWRSQYNRSLGHLRGNPAAKCHLLEVTFFMCSGPVDSAPLTARFCSPTQSHTALLVSGRLRRITLFLEFHFPLAS